MEVVLDTNILVSGIFFSGPPFDVLEAWRKGTIQFAISQEIAEEYERVVKILADEFPGIEISQVLTLILTNSEVVQSPNLPVPVCEDPDDDKFLACAISAKSKIIISGDKHLIKLSGYQGISILTPRMFVNQYLKR